MINDPKETEDNELSFEEHELEKYQNGDMEDDNIEDFDDDDEEYLTDDELGLTQM